VPAVDPLGLHQRDDGRLADEDGKTPASYEYNVDITRRVCEMSHAVGVSVEGELGCLGSLETGDAGKKTASVPRASSATTRC
jgi:fructose/tagatose bisphosphate aldolase